MVTWEFRTTKAHYAWGFVFRNSEVTIDLLRSIQRPPRYRTECWEHPVYKKAVADDGGEGRNAGERTRASKQLRHPVCVVISSASRGRCCGSNHEHTGCSHDSLGAPRATFQDSRRRSIATRRCYYHLKCRRPLSNPLKEIFVRFSAKANTNRIVLGRFRRKYKHTSQRRFRTSDP